MENDSHIGQLLALKDEVAASKHLIPSNMKSKWDLLKYKTRALEPRLAGTLLSLVKRNEVIGQHGYFDTDKEIDKLIVEFKSLMQTMGLNSEQV